MRKLTLDTLADVLTVCTVEPCVRVGIVFPTEAKKNQFARDLEKEVADGNVPSALYLFDIYELYFESASKISMVSANSANWRGRQYDIILYDEQVSDDSLEAIGYHERPIGMKRNSLSKYSQWSFGTVYDEDVIVESPELDAFLDEFCVHKN